MGRVAAIEDQNPHIAEITMVPGSKDRLIGAIAATGDRSHSSGHSILREPSLLSHLGQSINRTRNPDMKYCHRRLQ